MNNSDKRKTIHFAAINPYIDTLTLTRKVYPGLKSYKLQDLIKEYNLKTYAAHRALADVVATQQLYELLKKKL